MLKVTLYADSDWAGDIKVSKNPQSRSRGGYLLMINGDCVFWSSKLRTVGGGDDDPVVIDLSSQSAEVGTLSEAGRRMIWLKRALKSAGFIIPKVPVYEDNTAAIRFTKGQTLTERTRHIHRDDSFIRELERQKEIDIQYVKSENNLADFLTKIQPVATFRAQRDAIMHI